MGHKVGRDEEYVWAIMAEYIQTNADGINVVARDYLHWMTMLSLLKSQTTRVMSYLCTFWLA